MLQQSDAGHGLSKLGAAILLRTTLSWKKRIVRRDSLQIFYHRPGSLGTEVTSNPETATPY